MKKEESVYKDGEKFPVNFWDEAGINLLKDGTGYTIVNYGTSDGDVYHQYYKEGVFTHEEKVKGVIFGEFREK